MSAFTNTVKNYLDIKKNKARIKKTEKSISREQAAISKIKEALSSIELILREGSYNTDQEEAINNFKAIVDSININL